MQYEHYCQRCMKRWTNGIEEPTACRWCGNVLWNRERIRAIGGGRVAGRKGEHAVWVEEARERVKGAGEPAKTIVEETLKQAAMRRVKKRMDENPELTDASVLFPEELANEKQERRERALAAGQEEGIAPVMPMLPKGKMTAAELKGMFGLKMAAEVKALEVEPEDMVPPEVMTVKEMSERSGYSEAKVWTTAIVDVKGSGAKIVEGVKVVRRSWGEGKLVGIEKSGEAK